MTLEHLGFKKVQTSSKTIFTKKNEFDTQVYTFDNKFQELELDCFHGDKKRLTDVLTPDLIKAIYSEMEDMGWVE
jgi:hypothetical protein